MPSNDNRTIHITNDIWTVNKVIDRNPMYDESANELRQFREDENYRYRDRQLREEQSSRPYQTEDFEVSHSKKHSLYRSSDLDNFVRLSRQTVTESERTHATMVNAITGLVVWVIIMILIWRICN